MPRLTWTAEMDAVVREHYPDGGSPAVVAALGGAITLTQASGRAVKLGVRTTFRSGRRRWKPHEDEALRQAWDGGVAARLAALPGRSLRSIEMRGHELGLALPRMDTEPLAQAMARIDALTRARLAAEQPNAE
ncbi:MAG: hypothetical protein IT529_06290 [Burkholderiales bacterium]|nr:hypothetical protein [Burkholderiales bacterium]